MEMNKSPELVKTNQTASEGEPAGATLTIDRLVEEAETAVRLGNIQESREHLTRIFEHIAGLSVSHLTIHSDPQYQLDAYQMQRSA